MGEVRPELVGMVEMGNSGTVPLDGMGHFPPPQPCAQVELGGEGEKKKNL